MSIMANLCETMPPRPQQTLDQLMREIQHFHASDNRGSGVKVAPLRDATEDEPEDDLTAKTQKLP